MHSEEKTHVVDAYHQLNATMINLFLSSMPRSKACISYRLKGKRDLHIEAVKRGIALASLPEDLRIDIIETAVLSISVFMGARELLLGLSHVNRAWRVMMLGAPKLWSAIRIDIPGYSEDLVQ